MTSPGGARELPAGRLANFEGDDAIDLASLLPRRSTPDRPTPAPETPTSPTTTPASDPSADDAAPSTKQPSTTAGATSTTTQPARKRAGSNGKSDAPAATPPARKTAAAKTSAKKRDARDSHARSERSDSPTAPPAPVNPVTNRGNLIKPSSAQIPSALVPLIARRREETGRSNGEIVLDAIEATHPDLATLLHPRGQAGGGLFAARASRGVRKVDGPLTGLNIRLYEADYDVIDQLVTQFGALSRGHLISVALTAFLHEDSTE